jgi:His-Xaa-Ser system radical SAM maturase HxsC
MIPLVIPARAEGHQRFVVRLSKQQTEEADTESALFVTESPTGQLFSCEHGLFELRPPPGSNLDGDVVMVDPHAGVAERLVRSASSHNTFLVTERCDQLCVMCSQPPKKTHMDRWAEFKAAALLAPAGCTLGISGGEPTLYKDDLLAFLEAVLAERPDLHFHILSNGQHFSRADVQRLRERAFRHLTWGIPLYSSDPASHDAIVMKKGAHERLRNGLAILLESGAHVELRTVLLSSNIAHLAALARYVSAHLGFIDQWSIMQLENIGFARNRFMDLIVDSVEVFPQIAEAIDIAELYGVRVALFNFPRCAIPRAYQHYSVRSISDWKQKFAPECHHCREQAECSGFFEWHPEGLMKVTPI